MPFVLDKLAVKFHDMSVLRRLDRIRIAVGDEYEKANILPKFIRCSVDANHEVATFPSGTATRARLSVHAKLYRASEFVQNNECADSTFSLVGRR